MSHERSAGIVIGKVINVDDPESLGRIQVNYPWLSGPEQRWIPVAAPMAGHDRGMFFMPEIADEVIIAFEQGMWDHPYVIGFLWNPQQRPPSDDPRQRMIRSVNGHSIRFLDSTPASGNLGSLIIEDAHGNTIVLTNGSMRIEAVGRLSIHASGDVTIQNRLVRPLGGPI
ncbi:phage baseplate assembly protein V [Chitinimonas lacunae]|uniref:Phage baseplate assembly protein V n=1 Tax=Chitinimonas lacunae TaxID=1963018 RepID=A0ABV8MLV2_9NEIS